MNQPDFIIVSKKELFYYLMCTPSVSWPLWLTLGLGVVLTLAGAVCNVRVMMLGLILCLTMAPTMAFFIYFTQLIDTHIMLNMLPHTIETRPERYFVTIYRVEPSEKENEEPHWVETGTMTIFDSKVTKRVDRGDFTILHLIDSPVKVLYVPRGMQPPYPSCELRKKIIEYSDENTQKL